MFEQKVKQSTERVFLLLLPLKETLNKNSKARSDNDSDNLQGIIIIYLLSEANDNFANSAV